MQHMKRTKKILVTIEIICIVLAGLFVLHLLLQHSPKIVQYIEKNDIVGLTTYIRGKGRIGEYVLIILQVLETISIVLPALPIYITAGIVYGRIKGILICYITNIIINACMFLWARKRNMDLSKNINYGRNPKVEELMKQVKDPKRVVLYMCLLPVVPNGTIPFIAAGTTVTFGGFLRSLAMGCLPSIALDVVCGDAFLTVNWHIFLPIIIVLAILAALIFKFRKQIMTKLEPRIRSKKVDFFENKMV